MTPDTSWWHSLLVVVPVVLILALRFRSIGRARPLRPALLWVQPLILSGLAALTIGIHPPGPLGAALCLAAAAIGGLVGWHRGKLIRIERDAATGKLTQVTSPAAVLLLLGIIAVRSLVRSYFAGAPTSDGLDIKTMLVTDILLCFAVAMLAATRAEMALRVRAICGADGATRG